jgi:hypothetical protein
VYPFEAQESVRDALQYIEGYWGDLAEFVALTVAFNRGLMICLSSQGVE